MAEIQDVRLRRAPRLRAFLILGLVLGALVGLVIGLVSPESAELSRAQAAGWAMLGSVPALVAVSLGVFVWVEWRSRRRVSAAEASVTVEVPNFFADEESVGATEPAAPGGSDAAGPGPGPDADDPADPAEADPAADVADPAGPVADVADRDPADPAGPAPSA